MALDLDPTEQWALDAQLSWPKGWRRDFEVEDTSVEDYSDGVPERLDEESQPAKPSRPPRESVAYGETVLIRKAR